MMKGENTQGYNRNLTFKLLKNFNVKLLIYAAKGLCIVSPVQKAEFVAK